MKQCFLCGRKTNGAGGVEYYEHSLGDICAVCDKIRNQFAAAALTGMVSDPVTLRAMGEEADSRNITDNEIAALASFEFADAMMKARKGE